MATETKEAIKFENVVIPKRVMRLIHQHRMPPLEAIVYSWLCSQGQTSATGDDLSVRFGVTRRRIQGILVWLEEWKFISRERSGINRTIKVLKKKPLKKRKKSAK